MSHEHEKRTFVPQTIDGVDALVTTDPGELFIDLPAWNPRYIRVREGDQIQEGDVGSQTTAEMAGPRLTHWVVDAISAETVTGTDPATGDQKTWEREQVVQWLGTGTFSAELTSFDRVSVTELDSWYGRHSPAEAQEERPYVIATVYGNDGEKFTQLYAATAPGDWTSLERVQQDPRVEEFSDTVRSRFDEAVQTALETEREYHSPEP